MATELGESVRSRARVVWITAALVLLLPIGALLRAPVALLPTLLTGFFAFGLIALLYLVTEELLIEAHETPDRPWVTAMFCRLSGASPAGRSNWLVEPVCWCPIR